MMKLLGIILILFSTIVFAANRIALQKNRLYATKNMRDLCKFMADKISFSLEPLPDILEKMTKEDLGEVGVFLEDLCAQLTSGENHSMKEVWHSTLMAHQNRLNLSPKTVNILKGLGERLGTMSQEIELENIRYAGEQIEGELKIAEQVFAQNSRMFRSFGVLVGILIVILFI